MQYILWFYAVSLLCHATFYNSHLCAKRSHTHYHDAQLHSSLTRPFLWYPSLFVPYRLQFISCHPLSINILEKPALRIFLEDLTCKIRPLDHSLSLAANSMAEFASPQASALLPEEECHPFCLPSPWLIYPLKIKPLEWAEYYWEICSNVSTPVWWVWMLCSQ